MNRKFHGFAGCVALLLAMVLLGCGAQEENSDVPIVEMDGPPPGMDELDDNYGHGAQGPHGGHLIELGRNHKYHAEIVEHADSQSVTIHLLDTNMGELSIDDGEVILNIVHEGEVSTFQFQPAPKSQGARANHFVCSTPELFELLQREHDVEGRVSVNIDGVPYAGQLAHEAHDHSGHVH